MFIVSIISHIWILTGIGIISCDFYQLKMADADCLMDRPSQEAYTYCTLNKLTSEFQELYLAFNDIVDVSPLSMLDNLSVLDLEGYYNANWYSV